MKYYGEKDVVHIIDLVVSDKTIKHTGKAIKKRLRALPGEDVEKVVRCKDCEYLMFSDCYGECKRGNMGIVSPNDFCSYGQRKEGTEK